MVKKNFLINPVLIISSIYIPLLIFSFLEFHIAKSRIKFLKLAAQQKQKLELPQKLEAVESGYMPTFYPSQMRKPFVFPIGSLPNKNSYLCDEGYGLIKFKTDKFGLRNQNEKWNNTLSKSNIFLIGDSYVHGECVSDNETMAGKIEELTNINTINLGMGGNGPYEYMAVMKSIVAPILKESNKPNKAIITFYSNDKEPLNRNRRELLNSTKSIIEISEDNSIFPKKDYLENHIKFIRENYPTSQNEIKNMIKKNTLKGGFINKRKMRYKRSSFYYVSTLLPLRRELKVFTGQFKKSKIKANSLSQEALILLTEICRNNCQAIIAYIPWNEKNEYRVPLLRLFDPQGDKYKKELIDISEKLKIKFIDGTKFLDTNAESKDYAPNGGHLSIEGYKKFSENIVREFN